MKVTVNGEEMELPDGLTVQELLERLEVRQELVAVEVNRGVVPRERRGGTRIGPGDRVEIVSFVGGG